MSEPSQITKELAKKLLPERPQDSNKGTFGKVLNIAGCLNYQGAAYLSSVGALKVGAGLVTLASTDIVVNNVASMTPCLTFLPITSYSDQCIAGAAFGGLRDKINDYTVVSVGSGLSESVSISEFLKEFLHFMSESEIKTVIDADALNVLSKLETYKLPQNSVITPHPKELSRLLDVSVEEVQNDRVKYAILASEKFGCTTVLKGQKTIVCTKDFKIYENTTGNSALAKAGSGDVLTGMISGFAAQGLNVNEASILGVYLHGLCGDLASEKLSQYCVLATDQLDAIPEAVKTLIRE